MSKRKSLHVRFFDNPMDQAIQNWLGDVPKFQYGGQGMVIKTILFEHVQKMGCRLPETLHAQTVQRQALEKLGVEEKADMDSSVQENTDGVPPEYEYLAKLWPNIFNGVKFSGNLKR